MEVLLRLLRHVVSLYFPMSRFILSIISILPLPTFLIFLLFDAFASLYFRFCRLSPTTLDLDHRTTIHFWTTNHRRFRKPNLLLIHGFGGNSRWQFSRQVRRLSQRFNLYIPDLLFFGNSRSSERERTVEFQAKCVREGMRRLGVERYSIYGISYGGYVGYRMAGMEPEAAEKVVIVSSGIGATEEQMREQLKKVGRSAGDLLLPKKPADLRLLLNLSIYKFDPFKWVPDFMLKDFINMTCKKHRKEKQEMLEQLIANKVDPKLLPLLTQEILLIWGDKDKIFPLPLAHQLQRHLGEKSKLEIIKDTGHAANIDSPNSLNDLIISFVSAAAVSKDD